ERLRPRERRVHEEHRIEREEDRDQKGQPLLSGCKPSRDQAAGKEDQQIEQRENDLIQREVSAHISQKIRADKVHQRRTGGEQVPADEPEVCRPALEEEERSLE